jgi:hypothetical protein
MKKLKMFLFFFFALLLLPAAIVLGQDEIPTIPDWQYLYDNFRDVDV